MTMKRTIHFARLPLLLCLVILLLASSAAGQAGPLAEWLEPFDLPVYEPVDLDVTSPDPIPLDQETPYYPHTDGFLPDHAGYRDGTISVRVESRIIQTTKVLFTWIQIANPTQLRTALAADYMSKPVAHADRIAKAVHSVVAMSGDWYTARENKEGVVYRNGKLLRNKNCYAYDGLLIDDQGDFHILQQGTTEDFAAYEGRIMHSFVFGPALVVDGQLVQHQTRYSDNSPSFWLLKHTGGMKKTQRSVICQMDTLSYLIITTEGPEQSKDGGFTIPEMGDIAYAVGARQAFNLDGGSSAWLVLGDERINTLQTKNLRDISDIICFITAEPDPAMLNPATEEPDPVLTDAAAPADESPASPAETPAVP
jgi:exopolysaccharide biosynthesis protein